MAGTLEEDWRQKREEAKYMSAWEKHDDGTYARSKCVVAPLILLVGLIPVFGLVMGGLASYSYAATASDNNRTGVPQQAERTGDVIVLAHVLFGLVYVASSAAF